MHLATVQLQSLSPYSQSKVVSAPKKAKEGADIYELRTWQERLHIDDGGVIIPPMALRNCLAETAKYLSIQIQGKGKSTYTKHFESGLIATEGVHLFHPHTKKRIVAPSDLGKLNARAQCPTSTEHGSEADAQALAEWKRPPDEAYGEWLFLHSNGQPTGPRVWKCYPKIDSWIGEFRVFVTDDVITRDVFLNVFQQAGNLIGIGRWRPRNKGMNGRFKVLCLDWAEVK